MIKVGQHKRAKYWGDFDVKKLVTLAGPVKCYSDEKGEVLFNPTLVKIEWEKAPSSDKNEFWFPYWITIEGKEKYGQFAPMIGENALLELLDNAIEQDYFTTGFLSKLSSSIEKHMKLK